MNTAAEPRISIVTPAYRADATLTRMLTSVAQQKVRQWEHIIVIDGENDPGEAVARAAAAQDPRIRVIVQPQSGASGARNTGLAAATAEWILFLDADDTIERGHLTRMLAHGDAGADVVCCGYLRRDIGGRITDRYRVPPFQPDPFQVIVGVPPTAIHAVIARRRLLQEVGGFDPALRTNEDWDLWLRLARSGARFAREKRALASYWNTDQSLTRDGGAMIRDVALVMSRARSADPRVPNPLPDYANGLAMGDFSENLLSCALWSAAAEIGSEKGDGTAVIDALPEPVATPWNRAPFVGTMMEGLMVGSGLRYRDLAPVWDQYAPRFEILFARVEARAGAPGLATALMRDMEWDVARAARFRRAIKVGRLEAVKLGPLTPFRGIELAEETESLLLLPPLSGWTGGMTFAGPAGASLSAGEVRGTLARQVTRKLLRGTATLQRKVPKTAAPIDRAMRALAVGNRALRKVRRASGRGGAGENTAVGEPAAGESTTGAWDEFFQQEDPWNYGSPYEQLKYVRAIEILPKRPIGRAVEFACAEGMFTERLAPLVDSLKATDISTTALERAGARCAAKGLDNVDFAVVDFFNDPLDGPWDLIVSSEVLYYMKSAEQLEEYAARVADALAPGGLFVHAHAYEVTDEPDRTGFDWDDPFGAQTIARVFGAVPGLQRRAAVTTDLYLIELFERVAQRDDTPATVTTLPLDTDLDTAVASSVVWNGAIRTRPQVEAEERTFGLPVLMYHRIADEGPEALSPWRTTLHDFEHQLRFLRRRGYRSISLDEWDEAKAISGSLRGRPILITFDDAYVDFHENAWPILARNGFGAHMFVVTGKVGQTADWDAALGPPAPLMDWNQIADLHRQGLTIGSHLDQHHASDQISTRALMAEAARSKAILQEKLGIRVDSVAPPFGSTNPRVEEVLAQAGYRWIFEAQGSVAPVWGDRYRIPRIDIAGDDDIESFAAKIGRSDEPPESGDRP